jgi:hypothetical protein
LPAAGASVLAFFTSRKASVHSFSARERFKQLGFYQDQIVQRFNRAHIFSAHPTGEIDLISSYSSSFTFFISSPLRSSGISRGNNSNKFILFCMRNRKQAFRSSLSKAKEPHLVCHGDGPLQSPSVDRRKPRLLPGMILDASYD